MAELSSINAWNVPDVISLKSYATEIWSQEDGFGSIPRRLPDTHMKILENIWALHFEQYIMLLDIGGVVYVPPSHGYKVYFCIWLRSIVNVTLSAELSTWMNIHFSE